MARKACSGSNSSKGAWTNGVVDKENWCVPSRKYLCDGSSKDIRLSFFSCGSMDNFTSLEKFGNGKEEKDIFCQVTRGKEELKLIFLFEINKKKYAHKFVIQ
jgi:hypothetical protein